MKTLEAKVAVGNEVVTSWVKIGMWLYVWPWRSNGDAGLVRDLAKNAITMQMSSDPDDTITLILRRNGRWWYAGLPLGKRKGFCLVQNERLAHPTFLAVENIPHILPNVNLGREEDASFV